MHREGCKSPPGPGRLGSGEHCPTTLAAVQAGCVEDAPYAITERESERHSTAEESNVD